MMRNIGIPNGLSGVGYCEDDISALTERAWPQKRVIDNSARPVEKDEIRTMFEGAISYW